jgi:PAS domain-containing protein
MGGSITEATLPREGNRPVQVTASPFQSEDGEWLVAEVNVDISERKRIEEKNTRLAALVESSEEAITGFSIERTVTVWNHGAEQTYGYTAAVDWALRSAERAALREKLFSARWAADELRSAVDPAYDVLAVRHAADGGRAAGQAGAPAPRRFIDLYRCPARRTEPGR